MVGFYEISAEKNYSDIRRYRKKTYLLSHATYTGFAQPEKSSHLPQPPAGKLCFIPWKRRLLRHLVKDFTIWQQSHAAKYF